MPTYPEQYPGGLQQLSNTLARLRSDLDALTTKAFRIPILDVDPDANDPTNIWLFMDGRIRCRLPNGVIQEWVKVTTPGAGTSSVVKPVDGSPDSLRKTWEAQWVEEYDGDNSKRPDGTFSRGERMFGFFGGIIGGSGPAGIQKIMMGFDWADMATQLAGATIVKTEFQPNLSSESFFGGHKAKVPLGLHVLNAAPANFDEYRQRVSIPLATVGSAAWYNVSTFIGKELKFGNAKGLTVHGSNADIESSMMVKPGGAAGDPPRLRITYTL